MTFDLMEPIHTSKLWFLFLFIPKQWFTLQNLNAYHVAHIGMRKIEVIKKRHPHIKRIIIHNSRTMLW